MSSKRTYQPNSSLPHVSRDCGPFLGLLTVDFLLIMPPLVICINTLGPLCAFLLPVVICTALFHRVVRWNRQIHQTLLFSNGGLRLSRWRIDILFPGRLW